jgi:hypothetical protein
MIRTISLATALATTLALPAFAEDAKAKIEPGTGPTSTMNDAVPQMKPDAQAIDKAAADSSTQRPSSEAMEKAVPSMRPGDAVSGEAESKSRSGTTTAQNSNIAQTLSDTEAKFWINKPIYSSDGMNLGEVVDFQRDAANNVIGMHADMGGVLGFGQTRVNVTTLQFTLSGDRVLLDMTAEQAKSLPKVTI